MPDTEIVISSPEDAERFYAKEELAVGQWYYVNVTLEGRSSYEEAYRSLNVPEGYTSLMCITHLGSNYALLRHPTYYHEHYRSTSSFSERIHFDKFHELCLKVEDAEGVLASHSRYYEDQHKALVNDVNETIRQLAVNKDPNAIDHKTDANAQALVSMSSQPNLDEYKKSLQVLKEDTLPAKVKAIKENSYALAKWMKAPMMSLSSVYEGVNEVIDQRIFSISLYAGFDEGSIRFKDGEPAPETEPLHVFQRMLYCDEECLLDYNSGGMEFAKLGEFHEWMSRPNNVKRIFPFPKCVVAFKIRRHKKERSNELHPFVRFRLENMDKITLLYFRNGDRLTCVQTDLEFDEFIVPDDEPLHFGYELMFKPSDLSVMRVELFEEMKAEELERLKNALNWEAKNDPEGKSEKAEIDDDFDDWDDVDTSSFSRENPFRHGAINLDKWVPLDDNSVYFDDVWAKICAEAEKHNRIGLILQGIIDRSDIIQPFPKAKLWEPKEFDKHIKLVRDGRATLEHGEAPDVEAYFKSLRDQIGEGSVVTGQKRSYWDMVRKREEKRYNQSWGNYGNDGPLEPATIKEWKPRAKKATFRWEREKQTPDVDWRGRKTFGRKIPMKHDVKAEELLNYSAYKIGDYKQFFEDPRTRRNYLKWAPQLLTMERWHHEQNMKGLTCPKCSSNLLTGGGKCAHGDANYMQQMTCNECGHKFEFDTGEKPERSEWAKKFFAQNQDEETEEPEIDEADLL